MNRYKKIKSTCKLFVCISKNLRWLNEQVKRVLRYDPRLQFHVFTIFQCDCNVGVTIIIYLFDVA